MNNYEYLYSQRWDEKMFDRLFKYFFKDIEASHKAREKANDELVKTKKLLALDGESEWMLCRVKKGEKKDCGQYGAK